MLFLILDDDDGDDDEQARSETATAFTMNLDSTATAMAELATLDRQDLDATATELSVIATQTQESGDIQATESANATASAQLTETPIPTETATETPEPTEPPEPTATPEPAEPEEPTATTAEGGAEATPTNVEGSEPPAPAPGAEVYAANWNDNPDEWELNNNWSIDGGTLTSTGDGQRAVLAPDSATENATGNYAVEIVMRIAELNGCDGVGGPLGRCAAQDDSTSGYAGSVCRNSWRILAAAEDSSDVDELQNGSLGDPQIDDQPHTYRIEIDGNTIRLSRDGAFVGEATDDRFQDTGRAGIFLDGAINVDVSEFRVFAIETG